VNHIHTVFLLPLIALTACDDAPRLESYEASRTYSRIPSAKDVVDATDTSATDTFISETSTDTSIDADSTSSETSADTSIADTSFDTSSDTDADSSPDTGPLEPPTGAVLYPADRLHSPIPADLADHLRDLASLDPVLAPDVFIKVGASSMVSNAFLKCMSPDIGTFDLDAFSHLEPTRAFFASGDAGGVDPFVRASLAAKSGMSTNWAISGDPSPMEQEYLATDPRFAFVMYGANDMGQAATYEASLWLFGERLWTLIDELLSWGVIPIMMTIGHRMDSENADRWVPAFNAAIRGIAAGRKIPLIDNHLAFEPLPNKGASSDGLHASTSPEGACVLTPAGLAYGNNVRNKNLLEALDRVRKVMDGADLDPNASRLAGDGITDSPFVIPALPFTDLRSTLTAAQASLDLYSGCNASADESGPEVLYRLDVARRVRIRAMVHDLGDTDIDLHLLDETASEEGCIMRNHRIISATLDPGTYYFALDTFVSNDGPRGGEYIFTLIDCDASSPACL
jgi:hypothetical protein